MVIELVQSIICVIGLGYIGLPIALAFSRYFYSIGSDIDKKRIKSPSLYNSNYKLHYTKDPKQIKKADIIITAVPSPITKSKITRLNQYIINSTKTVASNMKTGSNIILESTVHPGVTDEVVKPILE